MCFEKGFKKNVVLFAAVFVACLGQSAYAYLSQNDPALISLIGAGRAAGACGPVAVANSYKMMEEKIPWTYDNSLTGNNLVQTAANLANLMNTQSTGTHPDDFIWYQRNYIEQRVPNKTVYEAYCWPTWGWSVWNNPMPQPAWVHSQAPNIWWISNMYNHGRVVNLALSYISGGGHFVTFTNFEGYWVPTLSGGGPTYIYFITGITFLDPDSGGYETRGITWGSSYYEGIPAIYVDYGGGAYVTMAVGCAPEPATLLLLGLGGLILRKRRA